MAKRKGPKRPPAPKKPPLTHFLCVPLVTPASRSQLEASLAKFRDDVTPPENGVERHTAAATDDLHSSPSTIPSQAVRPVGSLHCTLGVMSLDNARLAAATELLQSIEVNDLIQGLKGDYLTSTRGSSTSPSSLEHQQPDGNPIVQMKGLESMHSPEQTSILYASPMDDSGRLYPFCLALQKLFKDNGFLVDDNRQLKLHATIVNTIYAKGRQRPPKPSEGGETNRAAGHGPKANAPIKLDATAILERYRDFVWAEDVAIDRVAICEMGAKKTFGDNEKEVGAEYTEVASIQLPT